MTFDASAAHDRDGDPTPEPGALAPVRFGSLWGVSRPMRRLLGQLARIGASDTTLLVDGETGTGKTAVAEAIHAHGKRRERPFVVVDCGALPASLLEAELFGHEKGAFTGAQTRRLGAFEAAAGGTVFLDEIGELPLELQPKLLRVLESRRIKRLGSNEDVAVDVRVIAASHRDLPAAVAGGQFRADLYYRLAVATLRVPALRERPEDLPALVDHFLATLDAPVEIRRFWSTVDMRRRLAAAPWPGNVRELRNAIERSLVMELDEVPVADAAVAVAVAVEASDGVLPYAEARQRALAMFERDYVSDLLVAADGCVSQAARLAGLNRTYVHRLVARHGVGRSARRAR
jgi:two-component system, NtrC family, response regulator GlrR